MKNHTITGVGLLLFSGGRLMTVRELTSKPEIHKLAGMISFPLETFKQTDENPRGTIKRLLKEELGITNPDHVGVWGIAPKIFKLIPKRDDIQTFYGVANFLGDPETRFQPEDDDIEISGWKTPAQLLNMELIRIEVAPILSHFATMQSENFT